MASNMLITDSNTVKVHDSMFELGQETSTTIKQNFHNTNNSSGVKITKTSKSSMDMQIMAFLYTQDQFTASIIEWAKVA